MKNYGEKYCIDCNAWFKSRGSRHFRCADCKKEKLKTYETLPLDRQKFTRYYEYPDTISRSATYRYNKKYDRKN